MIGVSFTKEYSTLFTSLINFFKSTEKQAKERESGKISVN